jgi:membrane-associated protease RseP (regulator of RpoE activity)
MKPADSRPIFFATILALALGAVAGFAADEPQPYRVPYRIDGGNHIAVRIKVNGEGPYWFVVDTGAPGFVISPAMAARLGIKGDKDSWGVTPKLEIEGGPVLENVRTAIVPGVPDGVGMLGYTVLAHFKIEFDINRDYMIWTPKDWQPPRPLTRRELGIKEPLSFGGGIAGAPASAAYLGIQADPYASPVKVVATADQMMRQLSSVKVGDEVKLKIERDGREQFLRFTAAARPNRPGLGGAGALGAIASGLTAQDAPPGYIGVEFDYVAPPCKIAAVHKGSPAETAGLKAGDIVTAFQSQPVNSPDDVARASGALRGGAEVTFTILRNGQPQTITVKAANGF